MLQRFAIFLSHTLGKSMPLADRSIPKYLWDRAKKDSPNIILFRLLKMALIFFYTISRNWRLSKLYCGNERFIVRKIQGSKMLLDLEDAGVSRELLTTHIREPFLTALLRKELKKGDIVVDIGASIGYYALQEARLVGMRGKVYAIEPVIDTYSLLLRNIAMNGYRNIKTFNIAIGERNHTSFINVSDLKNCSTMSKPIGREYRKRQPVLVLPLDRFIKGKRHPILVRMDVEGYESEILEGMVGLLHSNHPLKIVMELHFNLLGDRMLPMVRTLKDAGFKIKAATVEAHPVILNNRLGMLLLTWLDSRIGARTGYNIVTIDDLLTDSKYSSGQIDYMEILFERI